MKFRPQSIFTLLAILVMHCVFSLSFAQEKPIPQLVKTGEKYTLMVDGKPFIMMGGRFSITVPFRVAWNEYGPS